MSSFRGTYFRQKFFLLKTLKCAENKYQFWILVLFSTSLKTKACSKISQNFLLQFYSVFTQYQHKVQIEYYSWGINAEYIPSSPPCKQCPAPLAPRVAHQPHCGRAMHWEHWVSWEHWGEQESPLDSRRPHWPASQRNGTNEGLIHWHTETEHVIEAKWLQEK